MASEEKKEERDERFTMLKYRDIESETFLAKQKQEYQLPVRKPPPEEVKKQEQRKKELSTNAIIALVIGTIVTIIFMWLSLSLLGGI